MLATETAVGPAAFALIVVLIVALALASRRKSACFGLLWAAITPLPVLAIGGRPLSAVFIACMGIAITLASVLAEAFDRLRQRGNAKTVLVAMTAAFWALLQASDMWRGQSVQEVGARWEHVRDAIDHYSRVPRLCNANTVLVLDTRFGNDRYHPLFITRLLCDRYKVSVYIPGLSISDKDAEARFTEFDLVLRDRGQDLEVVRQRAGLGRNLPPSKIASR